MKWVMLVLFIGCGANALGLTDSSDVDGLEDEDDFYSNITTAEKKEMTKGDKMGNRSLSISYFISSICFVIVLKERKKQKQ